MTEEEKSNLYTEALERFRVSYEDLEDNLNKADSDLKFLNGQQWPEQYEREREKEGLPCLKMNRMQRFVDQIVGDQRQNRMSIKIRPVDSDSDPQTARIIEGIIRNIESISSADIAYDTALENATSCGMGFMQVINRYCDDDGFDQELVIKPIANSLSVTYDNNAKEYNKSDAEYFFISDHLSKEAYNKKYPQASEVSFKQGINDNWIEGNKIRVAQYWYKDHKKYTIYQLNDGTIAKEKPEDSTQVVNKREVDEVTIKWCIMSGVEILEGPYNWTVVDNQGRRWGKYIPIIPVWGKELYVEGKRCLKGLIRDAKDAQRLLNYAKSTKAEMLILQPKISWVATANQIKGYEQLWNQSHSRRIPVLIFNIDPMAPNLIPFRPQPIPQQIGLETEVLGAEDDMKTIVGIHDAALGKRSNETSGAAIRERKRESDTGTFAYIDNLSRAMKYQGVILVDLIPGYYSKNKIIRIIGIDGKEQWEEINKPVIINPDTKEIIPDNAPPAILADAVEKVLNDMTVGKYDVVVSTGASYTTKREENTELFMQLIQTAPQTLQIMGDIMFKNMDIDDADIVSKRFKALLPPEIKAIEEGGEVDQQMPLIPQQQEVMI